MHAAYVMPELLPRFVESSRQDLVGKASKMRDSLQRIHNTQITQDKAKLRQCFHTTACSAPRHPSASRWLLKRYITHAVLV